MNRSDNVDDAAGSNTPAGLLRAPGAADVYGGEPKDSAPEAVREEYDRRLGYFELLDKHERAWLAAEVRMLHRQCESVKADCRQRLAQAHQRELNLRHRLAHQLLGLMPRWGLGKYATAGARRALDALYPTGTCSQYCPHDQHR